MLGEAPSGFFFRLWWGTITDLIQVPRTGGRNTSAPVLTCLCHRGIYHNHSLLPDKIQTRVNKQNEFIRILPQLLQRSKRCQGHYSMICHSTPLLRESDKICGWKLKIISITCRFHVFDLVFPCIFHISMLNIIFLCEALLFKINLPLL